jgi:hypothetical protein
VADEFLEPVHKQMNLEIRDYWWDISKDYLGFDRLCLFAAFFRGSLRARLFRQINRPLWNQVVRGKFNADTWLRTNG